MLHSRSLEIFTDMGFVSHVLQSGQEFRALNVYAEGRALTRIDFHAIDWQDAIYPFWLSLPQSETERCLEEHLAFGAGQVLLEPWLYTILRSIKYLVLFGFLLGLIRLLKRYYASPITDYRSLITHHSSLIITLLTLWTLLIFTALLRWMQITPASLGRLLYPTLPALGILTVWSLTQFRLPAIIPLKNKEAIRYTLPLLPILFLFGLSLISPFRYIQTAYAKTPLLSEADLPWPEITPLDWVYDDALRLIGYHIDSPTIQAGEWLPVTLYWQAIGPLDKNYSGFVHLLDQNAQAIAQANTYPDGGKWPTSMLPPDQVLADTYYVFIPPEVEAQAPLLTRLALGIFEFADPERAAKVAVNLSGEVVDPLVEGIPLLPHQWPEPAPTYPLGVEFADRIRLIGYDSVNGSWKPNTPLPLTLYWQVLNPPDQNLNLFIHLIEANSQTQVTGFDGPPVFPTAYWQTGQAIVDARILTLPPDIPAGLYQLRIGWYDLETFARLPTKEGDSLILFEVIVE